MFTIIYLEQTMLFLRYIMLQIFCPCNIQHMYYYSP